jgi:hypothetical protein
MAGFGLRNCLASAGGAGAGGAGAGVVGAGGAGAGVVGAGGAGAGGAGAGGAGAGGAGAGGACSIGGEVKSTLAGGGKSSMIFMMGMAHGIDFIPPYRQLGLSSTSSQIWIITIDALICVKSDPDPARPSNKIGVI